MIRLCPACQRRWAGVSPPSCPICRGEGVLRLSAVAVDKLGSEVAGLAVELALESAARRIVAASPATPGANRAALAVVVDELIDRRLLADVRSGYVPPATDARTSTVRRRARHAAPGFQPGDDQALDTPALQFAAEDRPLAAGGIPGFSAGGYVCAIARVADPIDPLDVVDGSTRERAAKRWAAQRRAAAAVTAITDPDARRPVGRPRKRP